MSRNNSLSLFFYVYDRKLIHVGKRVKYAFCRLILVCCRASRPTPAVVSIALDVLIPLQFTAALSRLQNLYMALWRRALFKPLRCEAISSYLPHPLTIKKHTKKNIRYIEEGKEVLIKGKLPSPNKIYMLFYLPLIDPLWIEVLITKIGISL